MHPARSTLYGRSFAGRQEQGAWSASNSGHAKAQTRSITQYAGELEIVDRAIATFDVPETFVDASARRSTRSGAGQGAVGDRFPSSE